MTGCGFGPCGRFDLESTDVGLVFGCELPINVRTELRRDRWHCYLCYVMPLKFPPTEPCTGIAEDGEPCRFVRHHRGVCKSKKMGRPAKDEEDQENPGRSGAPKLAAERERPTSRKSNRAGPYWVPPARRV